MSFAKVTNLAALAAVTALLVAGTANSAPLPDRASAQIDVLDGALISAGRAATMRERATVLSPIVSRMFNVGVMARFVVGGAWAQMARPDQEAVVAALARYMTARLGHEFANAPNVTLTIDPVVQVRGEDEVVRTVLVESGQAPDHLDYRMREYAGAWKVIDVYYNGVSELTTRRADLAATLATGDTRALVARIDATTAGFSR